MLTFFLFNTLTNSPEIEYVTDNYEKFMNFYWEILNEELGNFVTSEGVLLAKMDWWENEYHLPENLKPENIIVFDEPSGRYQFDLPYTTKHSCFFEVLNDYHFCPFIQFIHTDIESATAPTLKRLSIKDSCLSNCLPVMRQAIRYQVHQNQNEPPTSAAV